MDAAENLSPNAHPTLRPFDQKKLAERVICSIKGLPTQRNI